MDEDRYMVPIVSQELRHEETIHQIANALDYLDFVVKDIFGRIETRVVENKKKLEELHQRTALAKTKVDRLHGSNKATKVFSSAKYPAADVHHDYTSVLQFHKPLQVNRNYKVKSKHPPLEGKVLQEKLQFYHVKESNKLLRRNVEITPAEGLGSLPYGLDSISCLLLFNTSENPYKQYVMLDPLGAVTKTRQALEEEDVQHMEAAPISISQRDHLDQHTDGGENYFYSPGLGEVPQIDVPLDLPDLPGVAGDLRYSMDPGPMIAPSVSTTPAIPELPSLVPESPSSPSQATSAPTPPPSIPAEPAPPMPPPPLPPAPPPPPPPPLPPPLTTENIAPVVAAGATSTQELQSTEKKILPQGGPTGDARADLMAAIRRAGGSEKAKLRSAKDIKIEAKKKKQEQKAIGSGGDLMADLHAKLSLRRKGISGVKQTPEASAMDKVSAMIPPPPSATEPNSSNTEDDDDWE